MSDSTAFDYAHKHKKDRPDLPALTADKIERIEDLKPNVHPVFKVVFKAPLNLSPLVVKLENGNSDIAMLRQRYMIAAELMTFVSSTARAELMNPVEVKAIASYATPYMQQCFSQPKSFWVKMKFKTDLSDFQKIRYRETTFSAEQIAEMSKIAPKLVDNGKFWSSLGEILIIDLFFGNSDRISWDEKHNKAKLINPGNVFVKFDDKGNVKKAVGMDFFNGMNMEAKTETLNDHQRWVTRYRTILTDPGVQEKFANSVITEINAHFASAGVSVQYGVSELLLLRMALASCLFRLKSTLQLKAKTSPAFFKGAVLDRMKSLGWV